MELFVTGVVISNIHGQKFSAASHSLEPLCYELLLAMYLTSRQS